MNTISRFTIHYDENEDRIRLNAKLSNGESHVVWFTHRLLSRLIPLLTEWLDALQVEPVGTKEPKMERLLRDEMQRFKQQRVLQTAEKTPTPKTDPESPSWLVNTINVKKGRSTLTLEFLGSGGQQLQLNLEVDALRLTLNILLMAYNKAEWPLSCWPVWMTTKTTDSPDSRELH